MIHNLTSRSLALSSGMAGRCVVVFLWLTWASPSGAQLTNFVRLHSFGLPDRFGDTPTYPPIEGSDGAWYGVTSDLRRGSRGTVFKVNQDGTGRRVLHDFGARFDDGRNPSGALVEGSNHMLYGTTRDGGPDGMGTVFRLNRDGSGYTTLHTFPSHPADGLHPNATLCEASDGALYGTTTYSGGDVTNGVIFKLNKDGSDYTIVHSFNLTHPDDSPWPTGVIEGRDGFLYGTYSTWFGQDPGGLYRVQKDGGEYSVLYRFGQAGLWPEGGLTEGTDGRLYGAMLAGATEEAGGLFAIERDGSHFTVLHDMHGDYVEGYYPYGRLALAADGWVYGFNSGGGLYNGGTIFRLRTNGADFAILRAFDPDRQDGGGPIGVTIGSDGLLYGATRYGGSGGDGTVFRMGPDGDGHTPLVQFQSAGGDAQVPTRPLLDGGDGALYGISERGGIHGGGTFFKVARDGRSHEVLRHFGTALDDASQPTVQPTALVHGGAGVFYGTTAFGGPTGTYSGGILFRVKADGSDYVELRPFGTNYDLGLSPLALVLGTEGWLYGAVNDGRASGGFFRVRTNGESYELIRGLGGDFDPFRLKALLLSRDGSLYGTSIYGGMNHLGTVFRLGTNGADLRILKSFSHSPQREDSRITLTETSDGTLFGTTTYGGGPDCGTLFRLDRGTRAFTLLREFQGTPAESGCPLDALVEGGDGALYGSTTWPEATLFKVGTNGSGFAIVRRFPADTVTGFNASTALARGLDGAFYGCRRGAGEFSLGEIFRFGSALGLSRTDTVSTLELTGIPGWNYVLQRSGDLVQWTTLQNVVIPSGPSLPYVDPSPPASAAFYRLRAP